MKSIYWGLLLISGVIASARGDGNPPDINPASRYYQAFLVAQNVPPADRDQLLTNEWRGQPLTAKFGELVSAYNNEFRLLRAAARTETPCDWGLDLSEGPELLLPHLAQAKATVRIARLRAMWDLQNGRQGAARDDLLAALALGRNASRDGTLISALVQIAMESILVSTVAENFYLLSPDTLKQLEDGFAVAPVRGTMALAMATGEHTFYDWLLRKVQEARQQHPGDETATLASIRTTFQKTMAGGDGADSSNPTDKILKAAGGSSETLLKLVAEMSPMYDRATAIMSLPRSEYDSQIGPFSDEVKNSPNPLIVEFFPALGKCRLKEFAILEKLAMLRAAMEYKLHGDTGFAAVTDPGGTGPFIMQRFIFEGVDRGFQLKSSSAGGSSLDTLIFVEKEGVPFLVEGQRAGEAVSKPNGKE